MNNPNHWTRSSIDAAGQRLSFAESGGGPDVVLLHGTITGLDDMMIGLEGSLAERYHVVAFDRPGHGASTRPRFDGLLRTQAEIIVAGMGALGLRRPVLVGHSMGGALALTLATQYPDAISGVVALAPLAFFEPRIELLLFGPRGIPGIGPLMAKSALRPVDAVLLPLLWNAMFAPQEMPASFAAAFPFAALATADEMISTGEVSLALGADLFRNSLLYPTCSLPVRILGGSADIVVNNSLQGALLAHIMPNARFERLEGIGHMIHHFHQGRIGQLVDELAAV